ncbi:MAG: hypothetical protein WC607_03510 [Candidatus Micrarchaeia archaeon]
MDCLTVEALLRVATLVLAPIVLIYAFFVYKGEYYSRSLIYFLASGAFLSVSAILGLWADDYGACVSVAREACLLGAMVVALFALRNYVHSEIELASAGKRMKRAKAKKLNAKLNALSRK